MVSTFLDLERLRSTLKTKGLDEETITGILAQADQELQAELKQLMDNAMDQAIQAGVAKSSAEFINDLRPSPSAFLLETESGKTDFSDPPFPMLDSLLKGAKPTKDGSGLYKVIPVGKPGNKKQFFSDIIDAQKAIAAERHIAATSQYNKIAPSGSATQFRTATSKQSRTSQWVRPATDKDFAADLAGINTSLEESVRDVIERVIRSYEEG